MKYALAFAFLLAGCGANLEPCPPDLATPPAPPVVAPCPDLAEPPPAPCPDMAEPSPPDMAKPPCPTPPPCPHPGCPHHHDDGDCHTHHCHWGW